MEEWKARFEASQQAKNQQQDKALSARDQTNLIEEDDDDFDTEADEVSVPLTVTLIVIGVYVFLGALLFSVWEEWDWLKSAYYCFITIATIGFGDIVPGTSNLNTIGGQMQMLGAAFYILFGMATISMCFNLIQEEIVGKFHWIALKLGIAHKIDVDAAAEDDKAEELSTGQGAAMAGNIDDALIRRQMVGNVGKGKTGKGSSTIGGRDDAAMLAHSEAALFGKQPATAAPSFPSAKQPALAAALPKKPASPAPAWD